eukprot:1154350-Pelagomonas_calceolata.AAC.5
MPVTKPVRSGELVCVRAGACSHTQHTNTELCRVRSPDALVHFPPKRGRKRHLQARHVLLCMPYSELQKRSCMLLPLGKGLANAWMCAMSRALLLPLRKGSVNAWMCAISGALHQTAHTCTHAPTQYNRHARICDQVQALATQHNLAMEHVEIMGGGVMEWRRERDRHLCIYSGYLAQCHWVERLTKKRLCEAQSECRTTRHWGTWRSWGSVSWNGDPSATATCACTQATWPRCVGIRVLACK